MKKKPQISMPKFKYNDNKRKYAIVGAGLGMVFYFFIMIILAVININSIEIKPGVFVGRVLGSAFLGGIAGYLYFKRETRNVTVIDDDDLAAPTPPRRFHEHKL